MLAPEAPKWLPQPRTCEGLGTFFLNFQSVLCTEALAFSGAEHILSLFRDTWNLLLNLLVTKENKLVNRGCSCPAKMEERDCGQPCGTVRYPNAKATVQERVRQSREKVFMYMDVGLRIGTVWE